MRDMAVHVGWRRRIFACTLAALAAGVSSAHAAGPTADRTEEMRPPTIVDSIEMNVIEGGVIESPNHRRALVITHRGNIEKNGNDYNLWLLGREPARALLAASSYSNDPAITQARWVSSEAVATIKIGARHSQILSIDVRTGDVRELASSRTAITKFAAFGNLIVYAAKAPSAETLLTAENRAKGLVIENMRLAALTNINGVPATATQSDRVFLKRAGAPPTQLPFAEGESPLSINIGADGRFAIVEVAVSGAKLPDSWRAYPWAAGQAAARGFRVVDLQSGLVRWLVDAPATVVSSGFIPDIGYFPVFEWSEDGAGVILPNTFLPSKDRGKDDPSGTRYAIEVDIGTGAIKRIASGHYFILRSFDGRNQTLTLETLTEERRRIDRGQLQTFERAPRDWKSVDTTQALKPATPRKFYISEGSNDAPRVFASDGSQSVLVFDPNPNFQKLDFAHVETISWQSKDGHTDVGGLYMPKSIAKGGRYPLVIQTHGWSDRKFQIDGFGSAGTAAQALAACGIVVVQASQRAPKDEVTEGPENLALFEGLIEHLDGMGLIDSARVGIQAWSRSGYAVRYALAFSKYKFAAAVIADALEPGYLSYLNVAAEEPRHGFLDLIEKLNGGAPWREGLVAWRERAVTFNLQNVRTPIRELNFGPSAIGGWETFALLRAMRKPVELVWLPDAAHEPKRPSERITAQQGSVEWFRFWLQLFENPSPEKKSQYARWQKLKALRDENQSPQTSQFDMNGQAAR